MKNVTITLEEDVARWARIWAAKHDTSVSRILGEALKQRMQADQQYERAMRRFFARKPRMLKQVGAGYPTRENAYER